MKNKKLFKYILIILIWITTIGDIITFYLGNYHFETNPVYLISNGSIFTTILIKIGVLIVLSVLLFVLPSIAKSRRMNKQFIDFLIYLLWIAGISIIVMQSLGIISNLKIAAEQPSLNSVLPQENALKTYYSFYIWPYWAVLFLAIVGYIVYSRKNKRGDKT